MTPILEGQLAAVALAVGFLVLLNNFYNEWRVEREKAANQARRLAWDSLAKMEAAFDLSGGLPPLAPRDPYVWRSTAEFDPPVARAWGPNGPAKDDADALGYHGPKDRDRA